MRGVPLANYIALFHASYRTSDDACSVMFGFRIGASGGTIRCYNYMYLSDPAEYSGLDAMLSHDR